MPRDQKDDPALLWDMLESAKAVRSMTSGVSLSDYQSDRKTRRAVEREIEIIGEAARAVSKQFQDAHAEIPSRKIIAQRHRLSHEYAEIDDTLIWRVATLHIVDLIALLEPLIPEAPSMDP